MKQFFYLLKHWRPELPMASPTGNAVSPPSRGWQQWLSVAVLMIALFFGSSGTALAGERFDAGGTWINHHPTVDEPWITLRVMFYDPNGKDGFFLHDAEHGNNPGPAVYVDGQYVCSPDWQAVVLVQVITWRKNAELMDGGENQIACPTPIPVPMARRTS